MKKTIQTIMVFCMVLLTASLSAQSNVFKMQIKENKGECTGVGKMSCYLVKYHNSKDWEFFYAPIANFEYQEGIRYRVLVKRTKLENVPADAPSYKYEVVRVLNQKPMDRMADRKGKGNVEVITMVVKEDKVDCTGVGPMKCLQVKYKESDDWEYFYSGITNFKHEEGYRYTLKVKRIERMHVPADASKYEYQLIKILKKEKVPVNSAQAFLGKHRWKLIQLNGKTVENSRAYIQFDTKTNRVHGNGGCNGFGGAYKMSADKVTFSQIASTEMACPDLKMESELHAILNTPSLRYDIAEQTFNLYKDNKLVAMFGMAPKDK